MYVSLSARLGKHVSVDNYLYMYPLPPAWSSMSLCKYHSSVLEITHVLESGTVWFPTSAASIKQCTVSMMLIISVYLNGLTPCHWHQSNLTLAVMLFCFKPTLSLSLSDFIVTINRQFTF